MRYEIRLAIAKSAPYRQNVRLYPSIIAITQQTEKSANFSQ
jgi:hypothetical protein